MGDTETEAVIELRGKPIKLRRPGSYALRVDIMSAANSNALRAKAAALGLCWATGGPGIQRPIRVDYGQHGYSPLLYGGAILDELCGVRGIRPLELAPLLQRAYDLCIAGLVTAEDLKEIEGFTEATEQRPDSDE